jgi:hypothetical protein
LIDGGSDGDHDGAAGGGGDGDRDDDGDVDNVNEEFCIMCMLISHASVQLMK